MRKTPRHLPQSRRVPERAFGTLVGNGFLRESPRNDFEAWQIRGKSALRKCLFMPVPNELRAAFPPVTPAVFPAAKGAPMRDVAAVDVPPHARDPRRDVREMPAYAPRPVDARAPRSDASHRVHHASSGRSPHGNAPSAWWEDPVALGSLLILVPPIGLAAVWRSPRYSKDARWALTVMTALTMCFVSALVIAALALR